MITAILGSAEPGIRRHVERALREIANVQLVTTSPGLTTLLRQVRDHKPNVCIVEAALLADQVIPQGSATTWIALGRDVAPKDRPACPWVELPHAENDAAFVTALERALHSDPARERGSTQASASAPSSAPPSAATPIPATAPFASTPGTVRVVHSATGIRAVGIAVSTGGPPALKLMLRDLPQTFPVPILITQHIPAEFSLSLARSLDRVCSLDVSEARHREAIEPGGIYIAPGGQHMEVHGSADNPRIHLHGAPPELGCRPCANVMLRSMVEVYGGDVCAVVMTGMGADGKDGCATLKSRGGIVIAQDEASSVVYGMPRAVVEGGIADDIAPLVELAATLCRRVTGQLQFEQSAVDSRSG